MANERSAAPPPHRDLRAATGMSAPHQASPYEAGQGVVKKVELDTFLRRLAIGGPGDRPYAPLELAYWFHFLWLRALLCPLPAESALTPVALRLTYSPQPDLRVTVAHTGGGGSQDTWWLDYALDRQRIHQAPAALRG